MSRSIDRALVALPVVAVSVTWLGTAARHVVGGDNGELATIAVTGGAAHPPGYPLVAMYLHAMSWLPAESPAHASSIANALVAIAALGVLARACLAWRASRGATAIACLAWALAPTTWVLATQAEVFAPNALFAACILWLAAPDPPLAPERRAAVLALVAGLALTNHYTIATMAPLGLYAFVLAVRASERRLRVIVASVIALVAGALPYAFLFLAANRALDPASWSWGSVHDWASFYETLSRSDYPQSALNAPDHLGSELLRVGTQLAAFPVVALAGAAFRFLGPRRAPPPRAKVLPWVALGVSIALAGPAFMTVFHVPIEGIGEAVTERFDLLPMTLLVPCIARGLDELARRWLARPPVAFAAMAVLFALLVVHANATVRAHHRSGVEIYAENALLGAPQNAIILGTGDARLGSFLYARYAREERPDVAFVNMRLLLAPWYHDRIERVLGVELPAPKEHSLDVVAVIQTLGATGRPIFVTDWFTPKALGRIPSYPVGLLVRLVSSKQEVPPPEEVERINSSLASRFVHEPRPFAGPEPWSDALADDYARPWDALAQLFSEQGAAQLAELNGRRAVKARAAERWP